MSAATETGSDAARAETAERLRGLRTWLLTGAELGGLLIVACLVATATPLDRLGEAEIQTRILLSALLAAALAPPTLHLWRAHQAVHRLDEGDDAALIEAAMRHQARFWGYVDGLLKLVGASFALALLLLLFAVGFLSARY